MLRLIIFFLIIIRQRQLFWHKGWFGLSLIYHYISSGRGDGPTFEQFVFRQQSIEKNNVVDNNHSEGSTETETIDDVGLINKREKIKPKKYEVTFQKWST